MSNQRRIKEMQKESELFFNLLFWLIFGAFIGAFYLIKVVFWIIKQVYYFITKKDKSSGVYNQETYLNLDMDLENIDNMTGVEFEEFVAKIINNLGYGYVQMTPGSNDYGVDIIAHKNGSKYAIQCKRFSNTVGNKAIQEIYSGMKHYNADFGVVITNNYFTRNAINLASSTNIELWDRDYLIAQVYKADISFDE